MCRGGLGYLLFSHADELRYCEAFNYPATLECALYGQVDGTLPNSNVPASQSYHIIMGIGSDIKFSKSTTADGIARVSLGVVADNTTDFKIEGKVGNSTMSVFRVKFNTKAINDSSLQPYDGKRLYDVPIYIHYTPFQQDTKGGPDFTEWRIESESPHTTPTAQLKEATLLNNKGVLLIRVKYDPNVISEVGFFPPSP